jgi:hypothetical protein
MSTNVFIPPKPEPLIGTHINVHIELLSKNGKKPICSEVQRHSGVKVLGSNQKKKTVVTELDSYKIDVVPNNMNP